MLKTRTLRNSSRPTKQLIQKANWLLNAPKNSKICKRLGLFYLQEERIAYLYYQRIGDWLRHQSTKVVKPSVSNPLEPGRLLLEALLPPRKPRIDHVYQSLYYDEKIKPIFDVSREMLDAVGTHKTNLMLRNEISRELYSGESQEVIERVEKEVEIRFAHATSAYEEFEAEVPTEEQIFE